jgi:hypothetical protein
MAVPSLASASPTSGTERFQLTTVNSQPGFILAKGVFTASGVDYAKGNRDLAVFDTGAFTIHHPGGIATLHLNPRTCQVVIDLSGSYTISNGYGAYQGIAGSGTYTGTVTGVLPRNPNGTCNVQAQPFSTVTRVFANGPVSFA